jgi:hypothetical protein
LWKYLFLKRGKIVGITWWVEPLPLTFPSLPKDVKDNMKNQNETYE